ncbi:Thioesterase/thiol ester dehydrase-isomerase [Rhizodiscina lignyota]|uniref:Thioesterase/thiol ester dehydrase-isomerase n=1 Tax=Rhizodiscina lignyota TaxID=1504668 RepID=A0A9P4IIW6_9PEZI|nr:Thioesterase/thiol ester dehydrase-isomerase [Rhizodiscina lignyota]
MADDPDPYASPWNGNQYRPFTELMALEKLDDWTFRSIAKPFSPSDATAAYGGHVYAQAVYAASKTVNADLVVCNVTGIFTLPANTNQPLTYHIRRIRDGGMFATRLVDVIQREDKGICFSCTATFKREEADHLNLQERANLSEKYITVLKGKNPEDHEECPGVDSPWFWQNLKDHEYKNNPKFPGLHCTKVDMRAYNEPRPLLERRQLQYYAVMGDMPSLRQDPNLHACTHLYASDRNSLFSVTNMLDVGDDYMQMASLSHTVILHVNPDGMNAVKRQAAGKPGTGKKWFCQEAWATRNAVGRTLHESKIWDDEGVHIATTIQDGLVRLGPGTRGERMREDFERVMRERESGSKGKL